MEKLPMHKPIPCVIPVALPAIHACSSGSRLHSHSQDSVLEIIHLYRRARVFTPY